MLEFVLNFLFPQVCVICGKTDINSLCEECKERIKKIEKSRHIKDKNILKQNYKINFEKVYFDELIYIFEYKKIIRKLLLRYKFSSKSYISNFWANIILNNKKIDEIFKIYDIIIPVPMDKQKRLERGYNQTELITNIISKYNKILVENKVLFKDKKTKTQSTLSLEERYENIKNAFKIKNINKIKNKQIILFDDIYTTGATVNEISKKLKKSGAKKVLVLVIAKD